MLDGRLLRREGDGSLVTHADLSDHVNGYLNDMVVDSYGSAFVGDFGFDVMSGAPLETARIMRVDPDGSVNKIADNMWFPNGSVITTEGTLLVCESFANRITAFDITTDGDLANRRPWAMFGDPPTDRELTKMLPQVIVAADGCCMDAAGALWVADAAGDRVLRVQQGGKIDEEIPTGVGVFACMLGGADGRTLFLCAAPDSQEAARKPACEASLLATRVDSPHATVSRR